MSDMGAALCQNILLRIFEVYAMSQDKVGTGEAQAVKIDYIGHTALFFHQPDFAAVFRGMGMYGDVFPG